VLDRQLGNWLDVVRTELATVLSRESGDLLDARPGTDALARLAQLSRTATEPCPALASAVDGILAARLDYTTHLHPRVSAELRPLLGSVPALPPDRSGAEQLYTTILGRSLLAAARTRTRLLRDSGIPEQVVYAAVARFSDEVLAGSGAEREIRQLARAYRTRLWPDLAEELDRADAQVVAVVRAADQLLAITTDLAGPRAVTAAPPVRPVATAERPSGQR
jgi:hypothetical protein